MPLPLPADAFSWFHYSTVVFQEKNPAWWRTEQLSNSETRKGNESIRRWCPLSSAFTFCHQYYLQKDDANKLSVASLNYAGGKCNHFTQHLPVFCTMPLPPYGNYYCQLWHFMSIRAISQRYVEEIKPCSKCLVTVTVIAGQGVNYEVQVRLEHFASQQSISMLKHVTV